MLGKDEDNSNQKEETSTNNGEDNGNDDGGNGESHRSDRSNDRGYQPDGESRKKNSDLGLAKEKANNTSKPEASKDKEKNKNSAKVKSRIDFKNRSAKNEVNQQTAIKNDAAIRCKQPKPTIGQAAKKYFENSMGTPLKAIDQSLTLSGVKGLAFRTALNAGIQIAKGAASSASLATAAEASVFGGGIGAAFMVGSIAYGIHAEYKDMKSSAEYREIRCRNDIEFQNRLK